MKRQSGSPRALRATFYGDAERPPRASVRRPAHGASCGTIADSTDRILFDLRVSETARRLRPVQILPGLPMDFAHTRHAV